MSVRVASGSELKKERIFINKDGTLTTGGFKGSIKVSLRNDTETREGEEGETEEKKDE